MRALAWGVVTFRHAVVAGWIAAAVAATIWLPHLQQSNGGALSDVIAKNSEAVATQRRSAELFGAPITPDTMVVQRDPNGLSKDEQKRVVGRALKIDAHGYADLLSIAGAVPIIN